MRQDVQLAQHYTAHRLSTPFNTKTSESLAAVSLEGLTASNDQAILFKFHLRELLH